MATTATSADRLDGLESTAFSRAEETEALDDRVTANEGAIAASRVVWAWVGSLGSNNVTKLRASDGAIRGTFDVGHVTGAVLFDGVHIWVAGGNRLTRLRPRDGAVLDTFSDGRVMGGLAFGGVNIWISHGPANGVSKM